MCQLPYIFMCNYHTKENLTWNRYDSAQIIYLARGQSQDLKGDALQMLFLALHNVQVFILHRLISLYHSGSLMLCPLNKLQFSEDNDMIFISLTPLILEIRRTHYTYNRGLRNPCQWFNQPKYTRKWERDVRLHHTKLLIFYHLGLSKVTISLEIIYLISLVKLYPYFNLYWKL